MKNKRGFTLIELLVALTLFAVAAALVAEVFYQGLRCNQKIRSMLDARRPADKVLWAIEKDLKNAVFLSSSLFEGETTRLSFPSLGNGLSRVEYDLKEGEVRRLEEPLGPKSPDFKNGVFQTVMGKAVKVFKLEYAYRDGEGRVLFLPYWKGREGIPEALKVTVAFGGEESRPKSLVVFLPQGTMGSIGS